jgi:damage-control phosphatase, subfamily I
MKTALECIPCFLNQVLVTARKMALSEERTEAVLREMLSFLHDQDWQLPPPVMARETQRLLRVLMESDDPYLEQKIGDTRRALALLPKLYAAIENSSSPFRTAVQFSLAGNAIDFGAANGWDASVGKTYDDALKRRINVREVSRLEVALLKARNVLFLTDNCGEIVFDRPLLDQMGAEKVTLAVRGKPVINDATLDDAERSGLTERFRVVSNGSDVPGTWLEDCSEEFQGLFESADLVLAKGQGNYESLSAVRRRVWFLFMVKCSFVAKQIGMPVGAYAICRNSA